ncbi:hypothetical protein ACOSQ3_026480 [Xanthoceras sorbifolium]
MVTIRLVNFLLVLVFLPIRDATALTHQDMKNAMSLLVEVEKLDGVPSVAENENTKLGGRKKMMVKGVLEKEKKIKEEYSAISDQRIYYVLKKHHGRNSRKQYLKVQSYIDRRMLKSKTKNSRGLEISRRDQLSVQYSKLSSSRKTRMGGSPISEKPAVHLQESNNNHVSFHQNPESKKLLDSADEILELMNKDYPGGGRHKPPINNSEPLNQENEIVP